MCSSSPLARPSVGGTTGAGSQPGGGRARTNESGGGAQPEPGLRVGTNHGYRWWVLVHWRGWSWRGMPGAGGTKLTPETPIPHIFQISRSHSSWQQNVDKFSFRIFADSQLKVTPRSISDWRQLGGGAILRTIK